MQYKTFTYKFDNTDNLLNASLNLFFNKVVSFLELKPSHTVLDIGCGTGLLHNYVNMSRNLYCGIDLSYINLQTLESNAIQMDATQLGFKSSSFDRIVCCEIIEHIKPEKQSNIIKEIVRVLKPDGVVVISVPNAFYLWQYIPWSLKPFKRRASLTKLFKAVVCGLYDEEHPTYKPHFRYVPNYFKSLLTENGLKVKKTTTTYWYNNRYIFKNKRLLPVQDQIHKLFNGWVLGCQIIYQCEAIE